MKSPKSSVENEADNPGTPEATNAAAKEPVTPTEAADSLLKADHRKVEDLFSRYEAAKSSRAKAELVKEICAELTIHTQLEEEIFYPACREKKVMHEDLDEAQVEHDTAKMLIEELKSGKSGDEFYDAKVKVLSEYIKHHVSEEENPNEGIFAKAREAGLDMEATGSRVAARKAELAVQESHPPSFPSLRLQSVPGSQEGKSMPRYSQSAERDERGRFMEDNGRRGGRPDDDDGRGSNGRNQDRDENGRFMSDDDRGGRRSGGYGGDRDRDEHGRFRSQDERSGMYTSRRSSRYDEDDRGQGGWFGDSRGHSEAARRGWEGRSSSYDDDRRGSSGRGRDDEGRFTSARDDDDRHGSYRGRDEEGRFTSERGRSRDDYDDRRSTYRGRDEEGRFTSGRGGHRQADDDRDNGQGGWFGDSRGHAEAARRGWEARRGDDSDDRRTPRGRGRDDDDDGDGRGWHGDPEGHAEAARRGWRNR